MVELHDDVPEHGGGATIKMMSYMYTRRQVVAPLWCRMNRGVSLFEAMKPGGEQDTW